MAGLTRTNGLGHAHGTQYSTAQLAIFEIAAGASLAAKGGVGSTIEAIMQEVQPLIAQSAGTAGDIYVVVDGHSVDAASLQARVRALGTVDSIDLSSATVAAKDLDEVDFT
jgi:hypothetical protein